MKTVNSPNLSNPLTDSHMNRIHADTKHVAGGRENERDLFRSKNTGGQP